MQKCSGQNLAQFYCRCQLSYWTCTQWNAKTIKWLNPISAFFFFFFCSVRFSATPLIAVCSGIPITAFCPFAEWNWKVGARARARGKSWVFRLNSNNSRADFAMSTHTAGRNNCQRDTGPSSSNYILFCDTRGFINGDQLKVTIESLPRLARASFNNFPQHSAAIVNFLHAALRHCRASWKWRRESQKRYTSRCGRFAKPSAAIFWP